jgi:hypothetical protein
MGATTRACIEVSSMLSPNTAPVAAIDGFMSEPVQ